MDDEELKLKLLEGARWVSSPTRQSLANSRKRSGVVEGNRGREAQTVRAIEPRGTSPENVSPWEPSSSRERQQHESAVNG